MTTCAWIEDVERRDRLVADHEIGIRRDGAGEADALALAAGELVREALGVMRREADQPQERMYAGGQGRAGGEGVQRSGSARISNTLMRGLSEAKGSWNTICIMRRLRRSASGASASDFRR